MFSPDDIQARLHQRPFTPVRFVLSTGEAYDVFHPDLVIVGRRFVMIGLPSSENPQQAEQVTRVANVHVTEMRDLVTPSPPADGNGR